jgi:hypothetical protein
MSTFSRAMLTLGLSDAASKHARAIHATMSQRLQPRGKKTVLEAMCTFYACRDLPNSFRTVDQVCNAFGVDPASFLRLFNEFGAHAVVLSLATINSNLVVLFLPPVEQLVGLLCIQYGMWLP